MSNEPIYCICENNSIKPFLLKLKNVSTLVGAEDSKFKNEALGHRVTDRLA